MALDAIALGTIISVISHTSMQVASTQVPPAQLTPTKIELFMRQFCCDKTTEAGADEVYFLVGGRYSDGRVVGDRLPADAPNEARGHWNMNDDKSLPNDSASGDSHCLTQKSLLTGELLPGQSVDVVVCVMEEDQGPAGANVGPAIRAAGAATGNPIAAGGAVFLAAVAEILKWNVDSDDYIGSFVIHVEADAKGDVSATWNRPERVAHVNPDPEEVGNPRKREYRLNGDKSNYVGWFAVLTAKK